VIEGAFQEAAAWLDVTARAAAWRQRPRQATVRRQIRDRRQRAHSNFDVRCAPASLAHRACRRLSREHGHRRRASRLVGPRSWPRWQRGQRPYRPTRLALCLSDQNLVGAPSSKGLQGQTQSTAESSWHGFRTRIIRAFSTLTLPHRHFDAVVLLFPGTSDPTGFDPNPRGDRHVKPGDSRDLVDVARLRNRYANALKT
jgi:hypothetical protein